MTGAPAALRVAFAGTPEFAASALGAIVEAGFCVPAVLTQPDRPAGRGMKLTASAVKQLAQTHNLPVFQPASLRDEALRTATLAACGDAPDVLVVAAYGLLLPQAVLDWPRLGCINIHASLLPRWRGAAPIHRAIEAGDAATGITLMQMDAGLDTGAMLTREVLPILEEDTTASLHDRLAALGARMIVDLLGQLARGEPLTPTPQPAEGVTYAAKISKAEALLDWRRPAVQLHRAIRAFTPFPVAVAHLHDTPIKLWHAQLCAESGAPGTILAVGREGVQVACGEGSLLIDELQKPGSRRLPAHEFLTGFPLTVGQTFLLP